jgi:hypothetical protein
MIAVRGTADEVGIAVGPGLGIRGPDLPLWLPGTADLGGIIARWTSGGSPQAGALRREPACR